MAHFFLLLYLWHPWYQLISHTLWLLLIKGFIAVQKAVQCITKLHAWKPIWKSITSYNPHVLLLCISTSSQNHSNIQCSLNYTWSPLKHTEMWACVRSLPDPCWSRDLWEDQNNSQSLKEVRKWLRTNPNCYGAAGPSPWYPAIRGHLANHICWCEV